MSESRPLFLGPRLRRLRRELGLTQAAMAEDLGISPSYVALIEHNQRPVTADLLLRIARGYRLDLGELAGDDGADTARRLTELLRDPVFAEIDLPALEVADLAASFPGASEALVRLYRRSRLFLFGSVQEPFGLAPLEAIACGTPVVAARVGGLPTAVVDGVSGLLVDGHDPRVWANALCSVVRNPEALEALSRGAIAHASQFGWEATAESTIDVFRDALADRAAASPTAGTRP